MTIELLDRLDPVALDELSEDSALLRRFDAKYLVPLELLTPLLTGLPAHLRVLEVEGRRTVAYDSVYFDSPDLRSFRDHLKGRRRRYKVRTRRYDGGPPLLEVKYKGPRGQTVKERFTHLSRVPDALDDRDVALVGRVLADQYDIEVPGPLASVLATRYRRSTLVDPDSDERITIDRDLQIVPASGSGRPGDWRADDCLALGTTHAVVEVKSHHRNGPAHRLLRRHGLRPERLSKYCLGVTAIHDDVRGNPWLPALRQLGAIPGAQDRDRAA